MPDFLDQTRQELDKRLKELQPLVDEFRRLESAVAALAGVGGSSSSGKRTARRGPGRPRGSATRTRTATATRTKTKAKPARRATRSRSTTTTRRAGRRKGSGTRAAQALQLVKGQPGITIPELAAKMGIKQNYLYRVLPGLEDEGKVRKQGRGWFPKG